MPASLRQSVLTLRASTSRSRLRARPWVWWHLLSLDAPTVAVVWCWFLGADFGLRYSAVTLPALGLGTWLVYVADRLLDGWSSTGASALRDRHWFYVRHRRLFTALCGVAAVPLGYLILFCAQPAVRAGDIALCLLGFAYFLLVHGRRFLPESSLASRLLTKEVVVGFVFAAACALPAWARLHHGDGMLLVVGIVFGAVCWLNCVAIQTWEDAEADQEVVHSILSGQRRPNRTTEWLGAHLCGFALTLATLGGLLACFALGRSGALPLFAASISSMLFLVLIRLRTRLTVLSLRIAADAALLTPLLFWVRVHPFR